jgi:apolipoprotein N-acyltransferase
MTLLTSLHYPFSGCICRYSCVSQINAVILLVDVLLSRFQFLWRHILWFVSFTAIYLGVTWLRFRVDRLSGFPYGFLDYRHTETGDGFAKGDPKSVGVVVITHFGTAAWGVVAGALVVVVSRLKRCYACRK